jgi:hypothetical protein
MDLRGCKKVRALASHNVHAVLDICTCSAEELEHLDVQSILKHHAVPTGARGSYAYACPPPRLTIAAAAPNVCLTSA